MQNTCRRSCRREKGPGRREKGPGRRCRPKWTMAWALPMVKGEAKGHLAARAIRRMWEARRVAEAAARNAAEAEEVRAEAARLMDRLREAAERLDIILPEDTA